MSRLSAFPLRSMLLSLVVGTLLFPVVGLAQTAAVDLTSVFVKNGVVIDDLAVIQISGIVVIHGRTGDAARAEEAGRMATTLGYPRVANLIVVIDDVQADAALVELAQRRLQLEPALDGCRFHVDASRGIVRLTGGVHRRAQSDLAIAILSKIDGVKEIHPDLARL